MLGSLSSRRAAPQRFCLMLVKPTHYCDDGYPITWFRNAVPSNSLACVHGIAKDLCERGVLGDVELDIHAIDEANTRVRPERIARTDPARRRRHGDADRRAVEPDAARARHRPPAARGRHPGRHRRVPRLRRPVHDRRRRRRPARGAGHGPVDLRGRSRRAARRRAARRLGRAAEAALQFHERPAGASTARRSRSSRASASGASPAR